MTATLAWALVVALGPTVASAQCYEDTRCFYTCGYGYYQHAGSFIGCTDLCCPLSYHPLHAPVIIHHAPPVIVHHSAYYHPPTITTYHHSTTYHPTYHGTSYHPSTYRSTSYYRHYLMSESPAKRRAVKVGVWGGAALVVLACTIMWLRRRRSGTRLPALPLV